MAITNDNARANHGGMQAMSIDMDPLAAPANTSTSIGTRQICARLNENNIVDADEEVADGIRVDVTAIGIPTYIDNGTGNDPFDDRGGVMGYTYTLGYSSANLTVQSLEFDNPSTNLLASNAGSSPYNASAILPDDNTDDEWFSAILDIASLPDQRTSVPEQGTGNLDRLTITSETGAASGPYSLSLVDAAHVDAEGVAYAPHTRHDAYVAIDTSCDLDGDGIVEGDNCPTFAGPSSNNGCPPPGPSAVGGTVGLVESGEPRSDSAESTGPPTYAMLFGAVAVACAAGVSWRLLRRRRGA